MVKENQWQVFELTGRGESLATVASQLKITPRQVINLGIQTREVFKKAGLVVDNKAFRTLSIIMWAIFENLPDFEKQLLTEVIDQGLPTVMSKQDQLKRQVEKEERITVAGGHNVLFHTSDRRNYLASLPIEISALKGVGTVWLNLAELSLSEGNSATQVFKPSSETTRRMAEELKEHMDNFSADWEKGQREKRELINPELKRNPKILDDYEAASEKELVDASKDGDPEAFKRLYNSYFSRIFGYIFLRTRSPEDAEELAEEVLMKAYDDLPRFRWTDAPFSAWLFRIARNRIVDHYRRNGRNSKITRIPLGYAAKDSGPAQVAETNQLLDEIWSFARVHLTEAEREVFELRFAAGLSVAETALVLGKSENNVKVTQHTAIAKLKQYFGSDIGLD